MLAGRTIFAGVAARLAASGIPCSAEDILNPAVCAAMYIKEHELSEQSGWFDHGIDVF
jgi:hypothetical protein